MGVELRKVTHELTAARDDAKGLRVSFVAQLRVASKHSYEEHSCSRSLSAWSSCSKQACSLQASNDQKHCEWRRYTEKDSCAGWSSALQMSHLQHLASCADSSLQVRLAPLAVIACRHVQ